MRLLFFLLLFKGTLLFPSVINPIITLGIEPINEIALQKIPPINLPPRSQGGSCTYKGSYAITTNGIGKKITASLDSPLPDSTSLSIRLSPPKGAISAGTVPISQKASILVSNVSKVAESNLEITYFLSSSKPCTEGIYLKVITLTLID
jgi:hypothetical protein